MSAQIIIFPRHCPAYPPMAMPSVPPLAVMVITLQREHLHKLTFREKARLLRAAYVVIQGDDAAPETQVEQMARIHPIWKRIMDQTETA